MIKHKTKQNKYTNKKHRNLLKPKKISYPHVANQLKRPYSDRHISNDGDFMYKEYVQFTPLYIPYMYLFHTLYSSRYIILIIIILSIGCTISGIPIQNIFNGGFLLALLSVTSIYGLIKASDHIAFRNVVLQLNSVALFKHLYELSTSPYADNHSDEINVLYHYAFKHSKKMLFPSAKELAAQKQLFDIWNKSRPTINKKDKNEHIDEKNTSNFLIDTYNQTKNIHLSIKGRLDEHLYAKKYADWLQLQTNSDSNLYDDLVSKYNKRTIPQLKRNK